MSKLIAAAIAILVALSPACCRYCKREVDKAWMQNAETITSRLIRYTESGKTPSGASLSPGEIQLRIDTYKLFCAQIREVAGAIPAECTFADIGE